MAVGCCLEDTNIVSTFGTVELQLQLAQLFDILGPDGYLLHAEISASLGDNDDSNGKSPISGCMGSSACEIAKKILCLDRRIKSSEQASAELQRQKSQRVDKKSDKVTITAATTKKLEESSPPLEAERKEVKTNPGIAAVAAVAARAAAAHDSQVSASGGSISTIAAAAMAK